MLGQRPISAETFKGASLITKTYITYDFNASADRTPWTANPVQHVRMTPGQRLRIAREKAGFQTVADAAKALKLNPNTFTSNENGNRPISRKMAPVYADKLGVDAGWLLYGDDEAPISAEVNVPLVSWVSAGRLTSQAGIVEAEIERFIPVTGLPKGDWIALSVLGDSMNRIAPEGSVIIVNRAEDALLNDRFYVFSLEDGGATFKKFRRDPQPMAQPHSTNLDHLSIPLRDDAYYVVGRVRRVITDL